MGRTLDLPKVCRAAVGVADDKRGSIGGGGGGGDAQGEQSFLVWFYQWEDAPSLACPIAQSVKPATNATIVLENGL